MNKEQFAKCPFCGKSETLTIGKASDAFSEPDDCGDPMPYMHTESYAVTCDASKPDGPGGCGASGGYKLTEDEAIAAWNRRAALAQHQAKALEAMEAGGGCLLRARPKALLMVAMFTASICWATARSPMRATWNHAFLSSGGSR